ncbi:MAG: hypothetical protein LUG60_03145 [Erysipelotrichaceae bacterium]|nr:hypothetical protein [Erysipelotrichaceae bacterium]
MRLDKAFYARVDLVDNGYSDYRIKQLVDLKYLKKINASYYQNMHYKGHIYDYHYMPLFVYDGTLCLLSAAAYYGYIDDVKEIDVAVAQGTHFRSSYQHPPFRFHYYSGDKYALGVLTIHDDVNTFKIYNKERTVCDVIVNRKNINNKIIKSVLEGYLKDNDCNIEKLYQMAQLLHCQKTLELYLDMLL